MHVCLCARMYSFACLLPGVLLEPTEESGECGNGGNLYPPYPFQFVLQKQK